MNKLIQLPNGNWVRSCEVKSVRALEDTERYGGDGFIPPRVAVDHGMGFCEIIECTSMDAACIMRDKIVSGLMEQS